LCSVCNGNGKTKQPSTLFILRCDKRRSFDSWSTTVHCINMYSRRLFIRESKHQNHPNNGIALKGFFYDHPFLNHAIVIIEAQFAILINVFQDILYMIFKLICFLQYLSPMFCIISYVLDCLFSIVPFCSYNM
jgi:hypothetical protein